MLLEFVMETDNTEVLQDPRFCGDDVLKREAAGRLQIAGIYKIPACAGMTFLMRGGRPPKWWNKCQK